MPRCGRRTSPPAREGIESAMRRLAEFERKLDKIMMLW
jgi:hypothetical protein